MKVLQGIDISSVRRMKNIMERQSAAFRDRVFTPREQAYCEPKKRKFEHYAARFASKEALMKALEVHAEKRCDFLEIEVRHFPTGKPFLYLSPKTRKRLRVSLRAQIELSITHEREYAMASVLVILP